MPNKLLYACWMLLICASCRQTPEDYMHFVNDVTNGLTLEVHDDDVHYKAQLLPADYQILLARKGNTAISKPELDSLRALYNAYYYIRFEVSASAPPEASETALLYDAAKDFTLVRGRDSMAAVLCQPIANGKRHTCEYILAFPREAYAGTTLELVYDNPAWKRPLRQFRFKHENFDVTLF